MPALYTSYSTLVVFTQGRWVLLKNERINSTPIIALSAKDTLQFLPFRVGSDLRGKLSYLSDWQARIFTLVVPFVTSQNIESN